MEERIIQLENELRELKAEYYKNNFPQQQTFVKDVIFNGTSSFASLNPTTSFGLTVTPAVRQSAIATPSAPSPTYTQSEMVSIYNAVNSIRSVLTTFGFTL